MTDHLLAERGRIDNSHRMADETLRFVSPLLTLVSLALTRCYCSQAYATRAEFSAQRSGLSAIQSRMNGVAGPSLPSFPSFPSVHSPPSTRHSSSPWSQLGHRHDQLAPTTRLVDHGQRSRGVHVAVALFRLGLRRVDSRRLPEGREENAVL